MRVGKSYNQEPGSNPSCLLSGLLGLLEAASKVALYFLTITGKSRWDIGSRRAGIYVSFVPCSAPSLLVLGA